MKRRKLMLVGGALVVVALAGSCLVGGTMAKYVTEGEATDSARVAKWGVEVEGEGNAFQTSYSNDDTGASETIVVQSTVEVVAPGTYGTFNGIKVTGTPEVAVKVSTVADLALGQNWADEEGNFYCPIVIDVNGVQFCGLDYRSAAEFEKAVEDGIGDYMSETYGPGTVLDDQTKLNDSIQWRWAFSKDKLDDISGALEFNEGTKTALGMQDDEKDTSLGDKAADGNAPTIGLTLTTTVTQID